MKANKTREALGLLSSMVEGGEHHSDVSRQCLGEAFEELAKLESEGLMTCWVVIFSHKHGTDSFPMFQDVRPTEEEAQEATGCWEDDQGDEVEILGPWVLPTGTQLRVTNREDCPFYSLDYQNGSQLPHCGYNHLVKRRVDRKDKGTKTCDCFGVDSTQCPLQHYSEIRVRAGVDAEGI